MKVFKASAVAILASVVSSGCAANAAPPPPAPPAVTVAEAIERTTDDFQEFTGRLEAVDVVEVRPRVAGLLQRVAFREGTEVRVGAVLFTIDPRPYQAELNRAKAELERVKSRALLAHSEVERSRNLVEKQAISREEFDVRVNAEREVAASISAAEAAVETAALNLEWTEVRAPITGRIGRANVTEGNLVQAGAPAATLLTTIVSLDSIFVYFDADERAFLKYGDQSRSDSRQNLRNGKFVVQMALADDNGFTHAGRVDFVDNQLDANTGTIRARAVFSNASRSFAPGMFARVRLLSGAEHKVVLIRDDAVGTDQDRKFVFVLTDKNTIEYRVVQLGRITDGLRSVTSGVATGEKIVVNGLQRVQPGASVTPTLEPMIKDSTAAATAAAK
ncbi:MAG: efflux RND transporter periplasmic adaptor subunit [Phycisphaerae bacterium]|nr:efflux RND transporter periplasmic adaptor subunit [Gemmatimonadaceae bacterium]